MRRTRIKFCGFTRAEDLDHAVALGVDAVGLIAVSASRRRVSMAEARRLRDRVPSFVQTVLLLLDPSADEAGDWLDSVQPDLVQFHGRESPEFCAQFGWPFLKALPGGEGEHLLRSVGQWTAARGVLLDAHEPGAPGGTGSRFDWQAIPLAVRPHCILSGGLTPANVSAAIAQVAPWAVDVASGIESAPGVKSHAHMRAFVAAVREQDQRNSEQG